MTLHLDETLAANDRILVTDEPATPTAGSLFRLESEVIGYLGIAPRLLGTSGPTPRNRWRVRRAMLDTEAVEHAEGTALLGVVDAFVSGEDSDPPPAVVVDASFAPTLAAVLAEGNDPGAGWIEAAAGTGGYGGSLTIAQVGSTTGGTMDIDAGDGAADKDGGQLNLHAGYGDDSSIAGAGITLQGGTAAGAAGRIALLSNDTTGTQGQVPTNDGFGTFTWADPAAGAAEIVITEDASGAAGTYTGSVTVPGGATILPRTCSLTWVSDWSYNNAVSISLGDTDNPAGWIDGGGRTDFNGEGDTVALHHWSGNAYLSADHGTNYSATDREVIATVVVNDTNPPGTGILRVLITWAKATAVAATFEAAP